MRISARRAARGLLAAVLLLLACAPDARAQALAKAPRRDWVRLFDGRTLKGWTVKVHHHDVGEDTLRTFRAEDGMVRVRYDRYGDFHEQFGHLYHDTPYSYYLLVVEYRFVGEQQRGAPSYTLRNSGVMIHSQDPRTMPREQNWPISVEVQFLGGLGDGRPRTTGNMCSPGTEVVYRGRIDPRHCINSSSKTYDGDRWVRVEALVLGDSVVKHIVEGDTVLVYEKPQIGGNVVTGFDPAQKRDGKLLSEGFIALQSEGQPIDFRRVELLNLKGCTDPKALNYRGYFMKSDPSACRYRGRSGR